MGRPEDMAVVLRARNGRNILLQTRGISPNDVKQGSKEVVVSLSRLAAGADGEPASQGYVSVNNGRHNAVHRLVHSVYVIGIAGPSTALFSLVRVVDSVGRQIVAACKGADVTLDKVAKRYTEIYAGISATLSSNGYMDSATYAAESAAVLKLMFPDEKRDKKQRKKKEREAETAAAARASQQAAAGPRQRRTLVDGPKLGASEVPLEALAVAATLASPSLSRTSSVPRSSPGPSPRQSTTGTDAWGYSRGTPGGSSPGGSPLAASAHNVADAEWDAFDQAAPNEANAAAPQQQPQDGFASFAAFGAEQAVAPQAGGSGFVPEDAAISTLQGGPEDDVFGSFAAFDQPSVAPPTQPRTSEPFGDAAAFSSAPWPQEHRAAEGFADFGEASVAPPTQPQAGGPFGDPAAVDSSPWNQEIPAAEGFAAFDQPSVAPPTQPQAGGPFGDAAAFSSAPWSQETPAAEGFADFGEAPVAPPTQPKAGGPFGDSAAVDSSPWTQEIPAAEGFADFGKASVAPPTETQAGGPFGDSTAVSSAPWPQETPAAEGFAAFDQPSVAPPTQPQAGNPFGDSAAVDPAGEVENKGGWGIGAAVAGGATALGAAAAFGGKPAPEQQAATAAVTSPVPIAALFSQHIPAPSVPVLVESWQAEFVGASLISVVATGEVRGQLADMAPRSRIRLQGPGALSPASAALLPALAGASIREEEFDDTENMAGVLAFYSLPPSAVAPPMVVKVSVATAVGSANSDGELVVVEFAVSPKLQATIEDAVVQVELHGSGEQYPAQASPAVQWFAGSRTLQWQLPSTELVPGARGSMMAVIHGLKNELPLGPVAKMFFSVNGRALSGASAGSTPEQIATRPEDMPTAPTTPTAMHASSVCFITARPSSSA